MVADASQRDGTCEAGSATSHNDKSDLEGGFLCGCMIRLGKVRVEISTMVNHRTGKGNYTGCGI